MEDSLDKWISQLETEDDEIFNSSNSSFDELDFLEDILQQSDFSLDQTENRFIDPLSNTQNDTVVEGGATSPTNSTVSFDEITASFDGTLQKSNSSNSLISLDKNASTYLLSFDNSSVKRIAHEPSQKNNSGLDKSKKRNKGENNGSEFERRVNQSNKKNRNSRETKDHIMAERKRRQELTGSIIALAATIPGLKRMDKAHVLREALNYMKQLQERIKELENQNKDTRVDSAIFINKCSQISSNKIASTERNPQKLVFEIEARVQEKEVLIGIHCEKQMATVIKVHALLENLHLSVKSSSVLSFGTSILVITILAQMEERYNMTMDELVKKLRQNLETSRDRQ